MQNKKSYFIILLSIVLSGCVGYFIYDTVKPNTTPKTVDGEKMMATFNTGEGITEKEFYESLNRNEETVKYMLWRNAVVDKAIPDSKLTKDEKDKIKTTAKNIKTQMKSNYGDDYDWQTKSQLAVYGFLDENDYARISVKLTRLREEYVKGHEEEYKEYFEQVMPRKAKIYTVNITEQGTEEKKEIYDGYIDSLNQSYPSELVSAITAITEENGKTEQITDSTYYGVSYEAEVYDIGYEKNKDESDLYDSVVSITGTENKIVYEYSKDMKIEYADESFKEAVKKILSESGVTLEVPSDDKAE